ncbi:hypothetical protein Cgig2_026136 [Carnegiea gigantea]|uniref:Uncharacterized protein n=1 Tax=Carnegiea gigantea TaxID=171969 RepID=A0A9Q1GJT5_9CARY|nr:hypothetical protein Cgig2_030904 [Carnegiea gigantea]KAJ8432806.1 hypothetical protein Cgig2_026136 [Carnegiea gigantea]
MRILIDTDRLHSIENELILSIEDVGYKIMIKEASCVIAPQIKISTSSSMKIRHSNVEKHQGHSANDSIKTKTACISQNSYSKEILKISQHLENQGNQLLEDNIEASRPPGFDTPLLEESEELSQPLGFESATLVDSTPIPRKKAPKRHFEVFEKRMTRSQTQLSSILKDKPIQKGKTSMTDSSRTSKSDIRLAKEALKLATCWELK